MCSVQCDASNGYVTQAMIANIVNRNGKGGLPDVLFPTEGEKLAGNKTTSFVALHIPDLFFILENLFTVVTTLDL